MALADEAILSINSGGLPIFCHTAVWFWAAQVAQQLGLTAVKPDVTTIGNIGGIHNGAQTATAALPRAGNWDFAVRRAAPPAGTVLLWLTPPTHVAVVDANGMIAGYNQVAQFPNLIPNRGHTAQPWTNLAQNHRSVATIAEATIVAQAGALGL